MVMSTRVARGIWALASSALLLGTTLVLASCGPANPCAGQSGTCLAVEVRGAVGTLEMLRLRLDGSFTYESETALGTRQLPVVVGVPVPPLTGTVEVRVVVLRGAETVGYGVAQATLTAGAANRLTVMINPSNGTCDDGIRDGNETDRDCGGPCAGCGAGGRCEAPNDCDRWPCTQGICRPATFALAPYQNYPAGIPGSVVAGDVNSDGKLDLVIANNGDGAVSVLLGNGDGTFQAAINYPMTTLQFSLALGDVSGDGKPDVIVDSLAGISVLLGNGDGTFRAGNSPNRTGTYSISVVLGDVSGDGKLDLMVSDVFDANVSVLLGRGDGTFRSAVNYPVGSNPQALAVGDVSGDGKPDLAVANFGSNNVSVLMGNGDGTFKAAINYVVGSAPLSVAIIDVSGDRISDLAVVNDINGKHGSVLLGKGDGTFQAPANYPVGIGPGLITVGDINADGRRDLIVGDRTSIGILLGNGDGTFQTMIEFPSGPASGVVVLADFNNDGLLDIAAGNNIHLNRSL
jgi:hypothetical protein